MKFFTIGIYHSSESDFFGSLRDHQIQLFCDLRRRRGIRGKRYAYGNSVRLQDRLKSMEIDYWHLPELAPTTNMVQRQDQIDKDSGISRRDRQVLSSCFVEDYTLEILSNFDVEHFVNTIREKKVQRVVLFCLEQEARACHRSLVAKALEEKGYNVEDL